MKFLADRPRCACHGELMYVADRARNQWHCRVKKLERKNQIDSHTARYRQLKSRYGISEEEWLTMLVLQDSKCAICEEDFTSISKVHTDHSHVTGQVRALLCNHCNHGIGRFKENPEALRAAAEYLEHHN